MDHGNHLEGERALERQGMIRMTDAAGRVLYHSNYVERMACEHGVSLFAPIGCVECMRLEIERAAVLPDVTVFDFANFD